ncbi:MAG: hypothetical protein RMK18_05100 [Armatimonadota bacterium]|nr:hypothetical protein [Armatimonadota bacterium]MCX7776629.1 hypothetical protein [Armatimonadota bacterium]MDW8025228.1 hypothetical protein [Armatimonadota bacterium]
MKSTQIKTKVWAAHSYTQLISLSQKFECRAYLPKKERGLRLPLMGSKATVGIAITEE